MLLNRTDLINARNTFKNSIEKQKKKILICAGTGCVAGGSLEIYDEFLRLMKEKGINCEVTLEQEPHDETIGIKKSGCHGFCEMGPLDKNRAIWILIHKSKGRRLCRNIGENYNKR